MIKLLTESFWADEAFSALVMKMPLEDIWKVLLEDVHPPFYYYFGALWGRVFGFSEISLRLASFIFLLGACYFVYKIVGRFTKEIFPRIGAPLMVFSSPFVIYYGFEARMYSLTLLLSLVSIYFFLEKKDRIFTPVNVILLYTHYFGLFIVFGELILVLWEQLKIKKMRGLFKKVSPFLISFVLFLPWLIHLIGQSKQVEESFWIVRPDINEALRVFGYLLSGGIPSEYQFAGTIIILIIIFSTDWKKVPGDMWKLMFIFFFSPFAALLISLFSTPIFFERYLIVFSAGVFILANLMAAKITRPLLLIVLGAFFYFSLPKVSEGVRLDTREAIMFAKENATEKDFVVTYGDISNHLFESKYYGFKTPIYTTNKLPSYMGLSLMEEGDVIDSFPEIEGKLGVVTNYHPSEFLLPGFKLSSLNSFYGVNMIWYTPVGKNR